MTNMKLQTKFGIFWVLIVFLGITGFSAFMYKNTTDKAIRHAQEKAEIVLAEIEAGKMELHCEEFPIYTALDGILSLLLNSQSRRRQNPPG